MQNLDINRQWIIFSGGDATGGLDLRPEGYWFKACLRLICPLTIPVQLLLDSSIAYLPINQSQVKDIMVSVENDLVNITAQLSLS